MRVAYNLRFLPAIQRVRTLLSEGAIGRPLFARIEAGQWLPDWRPGRDYRAVYSASSARGGGVGLDLSHEIDYMRYLFGMPIFWKVVSANTGTLDLASDDVFEGIYAFPARFTCSVHLDYLERVPRRSLRIVGSDGAIECDIAGCRLAIERESGTEVDGASDVFDISATYVTELSAFFAEIGGAHSALATIDDARDVLRLLEEARGDEAGA